MIYVYLALFILSLLGLAYTLYSLEINRKLNIKKRQIAIRPNRNKFYVIFCINVILTFTFGGLFVYKLFYRPQVPVVPIVDNDTDNKSVSKTTPISTLKNDMMSVNYRNAQSDNQAYYYTIGNTIYRYDAKEDVTTLVEVETDNFFLIRDNIVTCYEKDEDGIKTYIDIYNKETLEKTTNIVIDGALKKSFEISGFFLGYSINAIVESFDVNNIDKIGYVVTRYEYQEVDEKIIVIEETSDKVFIKDTLMPEYHNYDRVLMHFQYSLVTDAVKVKSLCLTDYYLGDIDGYIYLFCNEYKKDHYVNESFILKYNPNDMTIYDYHTYNNVIYSSPIVYREGITTYISFIMYNVDYPSYYEVLIDNTLVVINTKDTFVDNKKHDITSNKQDVLVLGNKVETFSSVLFYDNNRIIYYEINEDKKKIVINEYLLADNIINQYMLKYDGSFNEGIIIDIKEINDNFFVTYEIDGKEGYSYFPKIVPDEFGLSGLEEKDIEILTDDKYFIVGNKILVVSEEKTEVLHIKELIKEDLESGE